MVPLEVGFSLAAFGLALVIVQGGLIRLIIPRIGDWNALALGLVMALIADVLIAFAWQGWMIYAVIFGTALSFLGTPSLQGIISKLTRDDAQGELQGVLTSVGAVATIIGPLVMTAIFGYFISENAWIYFPGAPFLVAGGLEIISIVVLICIWRQSRKS